MLWKRYWPNSVAISLQVIGLTLYQTSRPLPRLDSESVKGAPARCRHPPNGEAVTTTTLSRRRFGGCNASLPCGPLIRTTRSLESSNCRIQGGGTGRPAACACASPERVLRDRLLAAASRSGVPRLDVGDIGTSGSVGDRLAGATATRLAAAPVPPVPQNPGLSRRIGARSTSASQAVGTIAGQAPAPQVTQSSPVSGRQRGALRGGGRRTRRAGARPRSPPETAHRPAGARPGVARASAPRPPQSPSPHFSPGSRSASRGTRAERTTRPGVRSARSGSKSVAGNTLEARGAAGGRLGATRRAALSGRQCASRRLPDAPHRALPRAWDARRAARRSYPVGRTEPRRP